MGTYARVRSSAAVAISGVVASLSLAVALTVMVASFRASVSHWLDVVLPADLYVRTAIGPGAGEVVASLFMLLEHLISDGRFDHDALMVHVRAWRLMLTTEPNAEAKAVMLAGLKAIRSLHTQARAA